MFASDWQGVPRGFLAFSGWIGYYWGMSIIDETMVTRMAELSRLALTSEETTRYAAQLGAILEYAGHLPPLDTAATYTGPSLRVEADEVLSGDVGDLLQNARDTENGYVKVPAILDRGETS